ncbi:Fe(3+) ABC transporter substrate-binding protein [Oxalobacter sp. OttesenSCG-928-P03]|nr:Fe(3+) ABC transporter substrate-binding protein [Oxalobacter sp. OttesenSCG-928-P03]
MKQRAWLACLAVLAGFFGILPAQAAEGVVNLYSARHYESDRALYEQFTKETGIRVNVVSGKAPELIERIRREGENTQADVFITVDGGVLHTARKAGILQPMPSGAFATEVPGNLRDRDNYWVGLTTRARVIVYSKDRVRPEELSTYEALTDARWKGRVLVRSSADLYDQSLLASLIVVDGYEKAEKWAAGIVANMARQPRGNDRAQAKAIAAGEGDVAIMNTYYIGQMMHSKDPEEVRVAKNTGVFFPNRKTSGTHINISGAGLTKFGKNRDNAMKLIAYLVSVPAQEALSNGNYEYPVNPKAKKHRLLEEWGAFKTQQIDFSLLGENNPHAIRIFNKVGWK